MGIPQDPTQMSGEVRNKCQITNFIMPDNSCSMKYELELVLGLVDVGVPYGDGTCSSGPRVRMKNLPILG